MNALNEIAVTGAPAIVTMLGMGTVFLCLILLYVMTRAVASWLPRLLRLVEGAAAVETIEPEDEVAELPAARQAPAVVEGAVAAAVVLALARHRASRMSSGVEEPRGADAWKIAGRIRTLRVR